MTTYTFRRFLFEFLSIFIAVISAFALNHWNDNRRDHLAERKILTEIKNGLILDIEDIALNELGHRSGLASCQAFQRLLNGVFVPQDSIAGYYFSLTRSFISIQNTSGYETLKSKGLELIEDDDLRRSIIRLYEYDFNTMKLIEEEYSASQYHDLYFHRINDIIGPHLLFDDVGRVSGLTQPLSLSEEEATMLSSYLWHIHRNRGFILSFYKNQIKRVSSVRDQLELALD